MSIKVTVTVPAYLERPFEVLSSDLGLSRQDTFLHCLTDSVTRHGQNPSGPTARTSFSVTAPKTDDLFMLAPPERIRPYTFNDSGSCLRAEERGEYHEIKRGEMFSWLKFSRHSKEDAEGWEMGKNGKLCGACAETAMRLWQDGQRSFQ